MSMLTLLSVALVHLIGAVSPGPSFVLIARTAVARSRMNAIAQSLGLGLGAMTWAAAAIFGLTLLFQVLPWTFLILKIAGGLYILWIAIDLFRHASEPLIPQVTNTGPGNLAGDVRYGFLFQIANPKVSVYFGSVFVAFLPPDLGVQWIALILFNILVVETVWYALVSVVFATPAVRARYLRFKVWIDRTCGIALGALGLKVAIS